MSEQQHTFYCQELGTLLMCLIHVFKSGRRDARPGSRVCAAPPRPSRRAPRVRSRLCCLWVWDAALL